MTTTSAPSEGV